MEGLVSAAPAVTPSGTVVREDVDAIVGGLGPLADRLEGRSLLLTGGAGFLGYYLVQALLAVNAARPGGRGLTLTLCDNFIRGVPDWLAPLERDPALRLLRHDVTRPLPAGEPAYDYVIHAASIASPTFYRKHPLETMDANVLGLRLLLDRCRDLGERGKPLSGFLFFSSSEIYGDPEPAAIPTPESYPGRVSCTGPRACYDESKRFGETLCGAFTRIHGLPITTARPFNNYGPGLRIADRRVIPDFARDLFAGRDMTMFSDGSPTRTFCYISDAIEGYLRVLLAGRPGEAYNVGVAEPEISIAELAERLAALARGMFGYAGRVIRRASPEGGDYLRDNPNRRCPDIGKAVAEVGYAPRVGLDEGLRRSLCWYAQNREGDEA